MKKIDRDAAIAFVKNRPFNRSNTIVTIKEKYYHNIHPKIADKLPKKYYKELYLFKHPIARVYSNGIFTIRDAGWCTKTTKNRLNAVLEFMGAGFKLRISRGEWVRVFDGGRELYWDGLKITIHI